MNDGPNGGAADIATDGRLRQLENDLARLDERLKADRAATQLQATEYARRLKALNGEYERDRERQSDYVTVAKYEDKLKSEADARAVALTRTNEKLDDYVQRSELRQREIENTITTLTAAAAEAKRIAQDQGRQTREEADAAEQRQKDAALESQRRQTRNITIMGIALGFAVGIANLLPVLIK